MTNAQIIMNESINLMNEGIIKGTGQFITVKDEAGERQIELPETIHTFAKWKELGYIVRKGEKAIAQFYIWKAHTKQETMADSNGNEITEDVMRMFMKKASFFTAQQVDKVGA